MYLGFYNNDCDIGLSLNVYVGRMKITEKKREKITVTVCIALAMFFYV